MKKNKYGKEKFKYVRFEDMISPVAVCVNCSKVIRKHSKNIKPIEWGGDERCECDKPAGPGSPEHSELMALAWEKGILFDTMKNLEYMSK